MAPPIAGYVMWYDASDLSSLTVAGGKVSQWNDLSGNNYHFTQANGAKQPTTGVRTLKGRNVLGFDGSAANMLSAAITQAQPIVIFAVAISDQATTSGSNAQIFGNSAGGGGTIYQRGTNYAMYAGAEQFAGTMTTVAHVWRAVVDGASSSLFIDGAAVLSSVNPGAQGWSSNLVPVGSDSGGSAGTYWLGAIGEIGVYPAAALGANGTVVESYLTAKWIAPDPRATINRQAVKRASFY